MDEIKQIKKNLNKLKRVLKKKNEKLNSILIICHQDDYFLDFLEFTKYKKEQHRLKNEILEKEIKEIKRRINKLRRELKKKYKLI
jgi:uncharacterized protein YqiB (DUF1249 family)